MIHFEVTHTCSHCGSEYKTNSDWSVSLMNKPNITSPLLPFYSEIKDNYLLGMNLRTLAKKYNCQYRSIRYVLLKQGVTLRARGRQIGFKPTIKMEMK